MRGKIFAFILGGLAGLPVGAFLWYAFSPLLFDEVVSEKLVQAEVIAQGTFRDADRSHSGSGTAKLVRLPNGDTEVQLTEFRVTNGPDLEVWLSSHADPKESGDVINNPYLSLGALKGNVGDQSYAIPAGTKLEEYKSIVIWCEQFGVLFSPASFAAQ